MTEKMDNATDKTINLSAKFDQDSKRFHRFTINEGKGIVGSIYVGKDRKIPATLKITLE